MENAEIRNLVLQKVSAAKIASQKLGLLSSEQKNAVLLAMAQALEKNSEDIIFHNKIDVDVAKSQGFDNALTDRLTLNEKRVKEMVKGIRDIVNQKDPVGEIIEERTLNDGLNIQKIRVPLGTIAMIYESRPNVTVDAAALCIKSGNAVILRGGSEAINSNKILSKIISGAAEAAGMPAGAIAFIDITDRTAISELIVLDKLIDLLIPRGGEEFINFIKKHSTIPVLSHGKGLCHTYVDKEADIKMAVKVAVNAKCQRPGVCNATETLLVHRDIADKILPELCSKYGELGTEIRGCPLTKAIVPTVVNAKEEDWSTEYHCLIISIKVVNSLEEAIAHINRYGSKHSDSIITENKERAEKFIKEVDSAAVFHNVSTRLHDGGVFGIGAEIGIATNKLHARGAMGARELTTTKFIVRGKGHIRN
ncbi:MAG: glutamate-5-semialdehyde dehydrogenase [Endomicrobiaceae bacterium]|jgi:glutamate-5-semialdehyde dehydrogenase|nr:glutamate-5-semialdehyde dehydrogenase [Endomicrobiaceae bacterium]MDD3730254.1 glutamate-5-semialdehyde dehydrogenase [Endomicrobiaceae bacterium]MDD4166451.1 glutamate-5-semialdehyde dehydrogenase [Endomicrobiaceae bacterium]